MTELPHVAHVPMPLAGDGSSVAHVVRALTREHSFHGGRSTVVTSDNRIATFPDADIIPVDYTRNCPREWFTAAEYRVDWAMGALLLERRHAARLFEPAAEALLADPPDWVLIHEGHYAVTSVRLFRRVLPRSTKLALHVHNALSASILRPELSHLLRSVDAVISVSDFMGNHVRDRAWVSTNKLHTVYNGVDTHRFHPPAAENVRRGSTVRLLYVGQIAPHKGVHLLLEALVEMGAEGTRFETRIVGSSELRATEGLSEYERRLRDMAARAGGRVRFEPYVTQDQVADLYRWSDVVAVPSVAEPFGMVPLEAMASGALVLGGRSGALPEVLGKAGRLVDPNLSGWVRALRSLTRNDVEAARGPAVARGRHFTWARAHGDLLQALGTH